MQKHKKEKLINILKATIMYITLALGIGINELIKNPGIIGFLTSLLCLSILYHFCRKYYNI